MTFWIGVAVGLAFPIAVVFAIHVGDILFRNPVRPESEARRPALKIDR